MDFLVAFAQRCFAFIFALYFVQDFHYALMVCLVMTFSLPVLGSILVNTNINGAAATATLLALWTKPLRPHIDDAGNSTGILLCLLVSTLVFAFVPWEEKRVLAIPLGLVWGMTFLLASWSFLLTSVLLPMFILGVTRWLL